MSLRLPTKDDVGAVLVMLIAFHENSPYKHIPLKVDRLIDMVHKVIESDGTKNVIIMYTSDDVPVGLLVGQAAPFALTGALIASELSWWVDPQHRGGPAAKELLEAYEYWAKQVGCKYIQTVALNNESLPVLTRFYERKGYAKLETCFMKEL